MVAQNNNQQKNHLSSEEKMQSGKSIMPTFILILLFLFVFKKNNKVPQNLFILLNIYFPIWFIIYITLILIILSV